MPIINSILDTDLYKLTQQWAVLSLFPNAEGCYGLINRRPEDRFTKDAARRIREEVDAMADLRLQPEEREFLERSCPFLPPAYLEYLTNYRFNPKDVQIACDDENLSVGTVRRPVHKSILWEVPLMAILSEVYFQYVDLDWQFSEESQRWLAQHKRERLEEAGCMYSDFGTRRRRNKRAQEIFVESNAGAPNFIGTSNVSLAMKHNCKPVGTIAHEWYQLISVLMGLRHANRFALDAWADVYKGELLIALPDTFGINAFFQDFDLPRAKLWDGLRWDSGCPYKFTDRAVAHYRGLRIAPETKRIVYSDSLTVDKAIEIRKYWRVMQAIFGIGTHFTNDVRRISDPNVASRPLNIVFKLLEVDGVPTVKLSEDLSKALGDEMALKVARWTFGIQE